MTDEMIEVLAKAIGLGGVAIKHNGDGSVTLNWGTKENAYGVDIKDGTEDVEAINTGLKHMQVMLCQQRVDQLNGKT